MLNVNFIQKIFTPKVLRYNCTLVFSCISCRCQKNSHQQAVATLGSLNEKWHLTAAVCLERFPKVTQEKNAIEARFSEFVEKMEYRSSYLSEHEVRQREELKLAKKKEDEDVDEVIMQTAAELEDAWEAELQAFSAANRQAEADRQGLVKSSERKLDSKLLLIVHQQLGDTARWVLPQGINQSGESMRMTAERILKTLCGTSIEARFMGNTPAGFYKYRYPEKSKIQDAVGVKLFFFKAQLLGGTVELCHPSVRDFAWVTRSELRQYIIPEAYRNQIGRFVVDL